MNQINEDSGGRITGWGMALGPQTITNDDLASRMDTSNEWILERTGIRERESELYSWLSCSAGQMP